MLNVNLLTAFLDQIRLQTEGRIGLFGNLKVKKLQIRLRVIIIVEEYAIQYFQTEILDWNQEKQNFNKVFKHIFEVK